VRSVCLPLKKRSKLVLSKLPSKLPKFVFSLFKLEPLFGLTTSHMIQSDAQSQLVLLCQFLHLRALYSPSQPSAFAPPVLPPIVAQATGQEVAAVHSLFDELSNGPLLGGHGDALEKISKIATGSEDHVIEGVTCESHLTTSLRSDSSLTFECC